MVKGKNNSSLRIFAFFVVPEGNSTAVFRVKKYERIGLESQIGAITEYRCCWAYWVSWLQFWERLLAFFARIIATDARLRCPSTWFQKIFKIFSVGSGGGF